MKEKLTLSITKKTIERSKRLAKIKGVSLSRLVEDYLNHSIASEADFGKGEETVLNELLGCLSLDDSKDYKTLVEEARIDWAKRNESSY